MCKKPSSSKKPAAPAKASATINKSNKSLDDANAILEAMNSHLSNGQVTTSGVKKTKSKVLPYSLGKTMHAATGKTGKNLLLRFAIHAWEKDNLSDVTKDIPCDALWYDKTSKENLAKVATPEVAQKIIDNVMKKCPDSAPQMSGEIKAPDDYEAPKVMIVKLDDLTVNDEALGKPAFFFVGQMFVLKECLKNLFGCGYGEVEFNGTTKAAWYAPISEKSESVEAWLEEMGWEVIVKDLRCTDVED